MEPLSGCNRVALGGGGCLGSGGVDEDKFPLGLQVRGEGLPGPGGLGPRGGSGAAEEDLPAGPLTFLASLLPGAVDVVLELDADLPLRGLVADERELEQLLRGRAAQVGLDETRVNEVGELLRPGREGGSRWEGPSQGGGSEVGEGNHPSKSHLGFPRVFSASQTQPQPPPLCGAPPHWTQG